MQCLWIDKLVFKLFVKMSWVVKCQLSNSLKSILYGSVVSRSYHEMGACLSFFDVLLVSDGGVKTSLFVTLVSQDYERNVHGDCGGDELFLPPFKILVTPRTRNIIDKHAAISPPIKRFTQRLKSLLPRCIPNLQINARILPNFHIPMIKISTNSWLARKIQLLMNKTVY